MYKSPSFSVPSIGLFSIGSSLSHVKTHSTVNCLLGLDNVELACINNGEVIGVGGGEITKQPKSLLITQAQILFF